MLQPQQLFISWDGEGWRQSPFEWDESLTDSQAAMVSQTNAFAYELLCPTDWYVTRQVEEGIQVPDNITTWRQSIRTSARMKMEEIEICETKEELNAYTTSEEYLAWPDAP